MVYLHHNVSLECVSGLSKNMIIDETYKNENYSAM